MLRMRYSSSHSICLLSKSYRKACIVTSSKNGLLVRVVGIPCEAVFVALVHDTPTSANQKRLQNGLNGFNFGLREQGEWFRI